MVKSESNALGIAGEFRVMSELLLRGFNPAKSYLDNGIDIILSNGKRIQVKSRRKQLVKKRYYYPVTLTSARYRKGKTKRASPDLKNLDFLIVWGIDSDDFYIIPKSEIGNKVAFSIPLLPVQPIKNHFDQFKNCWNLLKEKSEVK